MPIEYRVRFRRTTESEVNVPVDLPTIFGDMPELSDKAVYAQAKSGALAKLATNMPPQPGNTEAYQIVSVYRGDVRVYPRPRKTTKDKPTQDKKVQDAPEPA